MLDGTTIIYQIEPKTIPTIILYEIYTRAWGYKKEVYIYTQQGWKKIDAYDSELEELE